MRKALPLLAAVLAVAGLHHGAASVQAQVKGAIKIDGSSTVYLISEKVATNFKKLHPGVNISIGISGTGGGFKKFANGETDISDASRPIKKTEADKCKANGIDFVELQVAWDGLAVILNKENTWARKMTKEQLKKIWDPDLKASRWSEVDPSWPAEEIKLYGPGADSGTFDYFTEAINGKEKRSRTDYNASEDDNVIIQGVERSKYALGYLGLAYYEGHKDKLAAAAIKGEGDYVLPDPKDVLTRKYPLSRPLFIYIRKDALKRPAVQEFTQFYLRRSDLVSEAKYVPMSPLQQLAERRKLNTALKGS